MSLVTETSISTTWIIIIIIIIIIIFSADLVRTQAVRALLDIWLFSTPQLELIGDIMEQAPGVQEDQEVIWPGVRRLSTNPLFILLSQLG